MKKQILLVLSFVVLTFAGAQSFASNCDASMHDLEDTIRDSGGTIEVFYDCLMATPQRSCSDEGVDAYQDGWPEDTLVTLIKLVGEYKKCKLLEKYN